MRRRLASATCASVLLLATGALSACSVSIGGPDDVSQSALEDDVKSTLADAAGDRPAPAEVTCEGGIVPEVDEEQRCELTDETGATFGLTVTVSEVDGSDVGYDVQVDEGAVITPEQLEPEVTAQLTELAGTAPDDVTCPEDLQGTVGATTTCVLTAGEDRLEVTVTTTAVDGTEIAFDIEVADEPLP